ncbi:MAG: hypothetical protein EON88_04285 [Brevundimonas sp.]|nr:MAG: hypothetical protein EON88_04285 [Brevundimonas sp.]
MQRASGDDMTEETLSPAWADVVFAGAPDAIPDDRVVCIRIGVLDFACRLKLGARGDRLMVHLLGAIPAGTEAPTLKETVFPDGFHVLTISDPSLLLDPALRRGVFLGPRLQDPHEGVSDIVSAVARQLGRTPEETLFYGASGSGIAGCMAAVRLGARCVAVNAQLDLYAARKTPHALIMQKMFDPEYHYAKIRRAYPHRLQVASAYAQAVAEGRSPRLMIYQNRRDLIHYEGFYRPFCELMNLDPLDGVTEDGRVRVTVLKYPGGHKLRPDKALALIARSLAFLYPGEGEDEAREAA